MSREDGIQLASRALAMLMIIWAFVELTYLPGSLLYLVHELRVRSVLLPQNYGVATAVAGTLTRGMRLVGLSVAALWLWNCGPGVQSAFSGQFSAPSSAAGQNDPPA